MKARALVFAASAVFAVAGLAGGARADEHSAKEPTAQQGETAARSLAEKYPFLDPEWSSRRFFPPEYCRYLPRIDRSESIYWDIKYFCERRRRIE